MNNEELQIFKGLMVDLEFKHLDDRKLKLLYLLLFDFENSDANMNKDAEITTSELEMQTFELLTKLTMEQELTTAAALKAYWDNKAKAVLAALALNLKPAQREHMESMSGIKLLKEVVKPYAP